MVLSSSLTKKGEMLYTKTKANACHRGTKLNLRNSGFSECNCLGFYLQAGKGEPHEFKEKTFKKKRQCGVCKQNIDGLGSFCRGK